MMQTARRAYRGERLPKEIPDPERAARLRRARAEAGYPTAIAAIDAFGWIEGTYYGYENGSRGFLKHVPRLARAYNVNEGWLRDNKGQPKGYSGRMPIVGIISAPGLVDTDDTNKMQANLAMDDVDSPPFGGGGMLAYRVVGDANYPAFFNGDVVYTSTPGPPDLAVGKQCVAKLSDGTKRVCILAHGSASLFLLMSFNASPISDAEVVEAAPIIWIRRA